MSDRFQPLPLDALAPWIFGELEKRGTIFGIPRENAFQPNAGDAFRTELYGKPLHTPFGVAAGPHTQMAQNIIAAWLHGARFIELKTVQTLDRLNVSKPCIDMQDEGYNVEWSQELTLDQSFHEYLVAWVLVHALHRRLGMAGDGPGMIFNMSVGYNLEGVLKPNVQRFLDRMERAEDAVAEAVDAIAKTYPTIRDIPIPTRLSDNVTLSTMHGCPPEEIGKIAAYLIEERGYHVNVKLNPTLLGPKRLRFILNEQLGFRKTVVPDEAFGHDLKYPDALDILRDLRARAAKKGVDFGVKLSNTLECVNHRDVFSPDEKMMYLSGRPLQALTVNLAAALQKDFAGDLRISYAGGADAFNAADLLSCGFNTVTVSSDILRPGGYTRLLQYIDKTASAFDAVGAKNIPAWIRLCGTAPVDAPLKEVALDNLLRYARTVLVNGLYHHDSYDRRSTKSDRPLSSFDCIAAPCQSTCPIHQNVPAYLRAVREGDFDRAAALIRQDNPMAVTLGRACNHACEPKCVRTHYDQPLAIREIKRAALEYAADPAMPRRDRLSCRVAIVGAGPCGIACAESLRVEGAEVEIFEAGPRPGGMASSTLPAYRSIPSAVQRDVQRLLDAGVVFHFNARAGIDFQIDELRNDFAYVVVAAGAQKGLPLGIPGEELPGVLDGLDMLRAARNGETLVLNGEALVVGGGDVAMDCARVAKRLGASVRILYRRTRDEMPAAREEVIGLIEENIPILELLAPKAAVPGPDGRLAALECTRMTLGEPDASGRRRPVPVPGPEGLLRIPAKFVVAAIGQQPVLDFLEGTGIELNHKGWILADPATGRTNLENLYAGGDIAGKGPSTLVSAVADGRRIAEDILRREIQRHPHRRLDPAGTHIRDFLPDLIRRRATRIPRVRIPETPPNGRSGFDEIVQTLSRNKAVAEARRCLSCEIYCSTCVSVCPNRAFITYFSATCAIPLPAWTVQDGAPVPAPEETFEVQQASQTAVFQAFCNECGNCATFCPTAGRPYRDKPRLFYQQSEFLAETANAFRITRGRFGRHIRGRFNGETHLLYPLADSAGYCYQAPWGTVRLGFNMESVTTPELVPGLPDGTPVSLLPCAILRAILRGIASAQIPIPLDETDPPLPTDAPLPEEDDDPDAPPYTP